MNSRPYRAQQIPDAALECRRCGKDLLGGPHPVPGKPAPEAGAQLENTYFSDDRIEVTGTQVVYAHKTYAVADIISVSVEKTSTLDATGVLLLAVAVACGIVLLLSPSTRTAFIGLTALVSGVMLQGWREYAIRIGTVSGDAYLLEHKDRQYIETIVDALNEAISDRR